MSMRKSSKEIDEIVRDRKLFNETVYTPLTKAIEELKVRWQNDEIRKKVDEYLENEIPHEFTNSPKVVLFRHLVTPNYELRRFMSVPDAMNLDFLLLEILDDKFSLNNPLKYQLAKLGIHMGFGKKGGAKIVYKSIIDFNASHKKQIHEVNTLWGESLVAFHHDLFLKAFPNHAEKLLDISEWLHKNKRISKDYYHDVVALFVRNAVLFENFILEGEELEFTKNTFLPAFFEAWDTLGYKPLIVALEPTEIEGDIFWSCYPPETIDFINQRTGYS